MTMIKTNKYLELLSKLRLLGYEENIPINEILNELMHDSGLTTTQEWSKRLPPLSTEDGLCFEETSEKLLVLLASGELKLAYAVRDVDASKTDPVKWVTDCSERWDITKHVAGWKFLRS